MPGLQSWMANLTLVYGLRLLPSDELESVSEATIKLKNGRDAHVTMHTLEGSKDEIEKQLKTSAGGVFSISILKKIYKRRARRPIIRHRISGLNQTSNRTSNRTSN